MVKAMDYIKGKDFPVITISREDIAFIIYGDPNDDSEDYELHLKRAEKHSNEFMEALALRMGEIYFNDEIYGTFRELLRYAWNDMERNGEIEVV